MRILLIDNYDSFVYNIAQYLGELGASVMVFRNDAINAKKAIKLKPDRILISPGPGTPEEKRYFGSCISIIRKLGPRIPILGVCLGHQGIAYAFGAKISHARKLMHGKTSMIKHDGRGIFRGVPNPFEATRYHSLVVSTFDIPPSLKVTAYSMEDCEIMGLRHVEYPIEGIQFHPESILTREGKRILKNFLEGGV